MNAPEPGSVWRHYKRGDNYLVIGVAIHTNRDTPLVIYRRNDQPHGKLWARPLAEWEESVSVGEARAPRFVRLGTRPAGGAS